MKPVIEIERNEFEIPVYLEPSEIGLTLQIARDRCKLKDASCKDKRAVPRDNLRTHHIGCIGEYAFEKLTGIPMDRGSYKSGKGKHDFIWNNVSIEVKTLKNYLTFFEPSHFNSDVAVLVIYQPKSFQVVWVQGWVNRSEFFRKCFYFDLGYGTRLCFDPFELNPFDTLEPYCLTCE